VVDFLNQRSAADLLNVSEATVRAYRARGKLPFQKSGADILIRREHVLRLLAPAPQKSWTRDARDLPPSILRQPSRRAEFVE
jgi:excisionase family DNA binding protein